MKLFKKKSKKLKIYCDVDETLVMWENPNMPYCGNFELNEELILQLRNGLDQNKYDVTIWSAGGKYWAQCISNILFNEYNLKTYDKYNHWKKIKNNIYAIDDRKQYERKYLSKFKKVYLPNSFIKYSNIYLNT